MDLSRLFADMGGKEWGAVTIPIHLDRVVAYSTRYEVRNGTENRQRVLAE